MGQIYDEVKKEQFHHVHFRNHYDTRVNTSRTPERFYDKEVDSNKVVGNINMFL